MSKTLIYLPDNPKDLLDMALNAASMFDESLEEMNEHFLMASNDGLVPSSLSLAGQVVFSEYQNIDIFEVTRSQANRAIATKLSHPNRYYTSHVQFLDAIYSGNRMDIIDFLIPRCIANIELFPEEYYVGKPDSISGYAEHNFNYSNVIDSISDYVYYSMKGFNRDEYQTGVEGLIMRICRLQEVVKQYFIYVPSKLE